MKWIFFLLFTFLFTTGCNEQQARLQTKEAALNKKEQDLVLKEKTLQLREEALIKREQQLDSSMKKDSIAVYDSSLVGSWSVKMNCIETNCPGSAVGDTKTEQWNITYQENNIIAKVVTDGSLVRLYSGKYNGTTVELTTPQIDTSSKAAATMIVRLQQTAKARLEGRREITRAEGCRIVYAMDLVKQDNPITF